MAAAIGKHSADPPKALPCERPCPLGSFEHLFDGPYIPAPPMSHAPHALKNGLTARPRLIVDQLNSTALKWGDDGELSELDLQRILRLLSQADPVAEALVAQVSDAVN